MLNANSADVNNIVITVLLSSAVFAALITSLTNLVISLLNNRRLKTIEKQKNMSEIDKYRYSRLYEMLLNWHNYDSEIKGDSADEIAFYRLLNGFMDDSGRYNIVKPLLDENFIPELEQLRKVGDELLRELIQAENPDGTHKENFSVIKDKYSKIGIAFSKALKDAINQQLKILLNNKK